MIKTLLSEHETGSKVVPHILRRAEKRHRVLREALKPEFKLQHYRQRE